MDDKCTENVPNNKMNEKMTDADKKHKRMQTRLKSTSVLDLL